MVSIAAVIVFSACAVTAIVQEQPETAAPTVSPLQLSDNRGGRDDNPEPADTEAQTATAQPEPTQEAPQMNNPTRSLDWGDEDAAILIQIAMAEAEGESTEGKALVMLVVLNRVWDERFPDTIEEVVFQENQFTPTEPGGRYWTTVPSEDCYEALELVERGWDESQGALYFESTGRDGWHSQNLEFLFQEGGHKFYR